MSCIHDNCKRKGIYGNLTLCREHRIVVSHQQNTAYKPIKCEYSGGGLSQSRLINISTRDSSNNTIVVASKYVVTENLYLPEKYKPPINASDDLTVEEENIQKGSSSSHEWKLCGSRLLLPEWTLIYLHKCSKCNIFGYRGDIRRVDRRNLEHNNEHYYDSDNSDDSDDPAHAEHFDASYTNIENVECLEDEFA